MCYYHLRDNGEIIATIYYGISIVSESEPKNRINIKKGRAKAEARMIQAATINSDIQWKRYNSKKHKPSSFRVYMIKSVGFKKLGKCSPRTLKNRIQKLKDELQK
jgi:hypothetical protein